MKTPATDPAPAKIPSATEAELARLNEEIALVENEPLLSDRIERLSAQVFMIENAVANYSRRLVEVECELASLQAFGKQAESHGESFRFNVDRLYFAAHVDSAPEYLELIRFHQSIIALGWWMKNQSSKIDTKKAAVAEIKRKISAREKEAAPLKSELSDLQSKMDRIKRKHDDSLLGGLVGWLSSPSEDAAPETAEQTAGNERWRRRRSSEEAAV